MCKCSEVIFLVEFHIGINVGSRNEPWLWFLEFSAYDEESSQEFLCTSCIPREEKWLVMDSFGGESEEMVCWW